MNNMPRFLGHIEINNETGCWEWQSHRNNNGYGWFWYPPFGKQITAHRASYIMHNGDIPAGKYVLHDCHNRACVNPAHLRIGTAKDNMRDKVEAGRCNSQRPKLTWPQVEEIRARHADGETQMALAADFGVTNVNISYVVRGKTWNPARKAA